MSAPEAGGLQRQIRTGALALAIANLLVGAGIFGLPGLVAAEVGSAAPLAIIGCAVVAGLVGLCLAEVGSRVTASGGMYAYTDAAFGRVAAAVVGTLTWFLFGALANAAVSLLLASTVARFVPALEGGLPRTIFLVLVYAAIAAVNIRGLREAIRATAVISVLKFLPLVALVVAGLFLLEPANLEVEAWPTTDGIAASIVIVYFAFVGTEGALSASGEVLEPSRTVPRAIALGLGLVAILYIGLQVVAQGVLGPVLEHSGDAPLLATAHAMFGRGGGAMILIATAASTLGLLFADVMTMPRVLFALGNDRLMPGVLGRVHPRFHTPHVAIAAYTLVCLGLALSGTFRQLVVLSSAGTMLMHFAIALAVFKLRRHPQYATVQGFRAPGGPLVPGLTAAALVWLFSTLRPVEHLFLAGVCVLAALPALLQRRRRTAAT
ncbi:MAG: APC family permease [Gemmatimonadales bacterium]